MKFVFADSLDFIDPDYDFAADRSGAGRSVHRDDLYPHEFLDQAPYDGSSFREALSVTPDPGNIPSLNSCASAVKARASFCDIR